MAFKKSKLFSTIWDACNKLRGGMDSSQYKDYVLTILFVKYVSDKANDPKSIIVVPPGASFADMAALKGKADIGDKINVILAELAKANDLVGVVDVVDFNDSSKLGTGKDMIDRLTGLVGIFEHQNLNFAMHRAANADVLGDAYEFLMKRFAQESGKSKGQFYTPGEVSTMLARFVGAHNATQGQTIYDPTCGSGSLLLRCHAEAMDSTGADLSVHGQEMDVATTSISRINMVIHGLADADIKQGNTMANPQFKRQTGLKSVDGIEHPLMVLRQFDYCVANPPFSNKEWLIGVDPANDPYHRFELGTPPAKNGDYAFLLHIIASMNSTGKAAIVLPHGVLFRGNAESLIRKNIIAKGWIKAVIGLPANLFYGTGIPACVIILDKEEPEKREGIFMIDASKGFAKDGNKNKLRARDMRKIMDAYEGQVAVDKFSRMVPFSEIDKNDGNLNIPRYIDSNEPEDIQDLGGHLLGGIPVSDIDALGSLWTECPSLRGELFEPLRDGYVQLRIPAGQIKAAMAANVEFQSLSQNIENAFDIWKNKAKADLAAIALDDKPKAVVEKAGVDLLADFAAVPLLDRYDVYQHLMTLWEESMQDDVSTIASDGWLSCKDITEVVAAPKSKDGDKAEKADFNIQVGSGKGSKRYQSDIIVPDLVAQRWFPQHKASLLSAQASLAAAEQLISDTFEEHGVEDGFLFDFVEDGKWRPAEKAAGAAKAIPNGQKRLEKAMAGGSREDGTEFGADNAAIAKNLLAAIESVSELNAKAAALSTVLWGEVAGKICSMTEDEIKTSVIDDKWLAKIEEAIHSEVSRVIHEKTARIEELGNRYASTINDLEAKRDELAKKNTANMKLLGY